MKALDYLDMPECIYVNHEVQMSEPERKLYDQLKRDSILPLANGDIDAKNAAALSNKLLQMSHGAVYDEFNETRVIHNGKLEMLDDLIEQANGQSVLIAYWFRHDRARIVEHLIAQGYDPRDIRESDDIKDWNEGKIDVGLIHPASAGHAGTSVQGGCRPVLIVSNDVGNTYAETLNVLPMTRQLKKPDLPCHTELDPETITDKHQLMDNSMILAEQITTISKDQLRNYVGRIEGEDLIAAVNRAVSMQLGLTPLSGQSDERSACI